MNGQGIIHQNEECIILRDGRQVVLRPATVEDFDAIQKYVAQLTKETVVSEQYPGRLLNSRAEMELDCENPNALFVLSVDEGAEVVGMLSARIVVPDNLWEKTSCRFFIHMLKRYQGFGLGTRFMTILEDWARAKGAAQIEETIRHTSIQGISLYLKQGFKVEQSMRDVVCIQNEWYHEYKIAKTL